MTSNNTSARCTNLTLAWRDVLQTFFNVVWKDVEVLRKVGSYIRLWLLTICCWEGISICLRPLMQMGVESNLLIPIFRHQYSFEVEYCCDQIKFSTIVIHVHCLIILSQLP